MSKDYYEPAFDVKYYKKTAKELGYNIIMPEIMKRLDYCTSHAEAGRVLATARERMSKLKDKN